MTKFLLIRHATTDSIGKRLAGRMAGVHLNAEGLQQAEKLATQLTHLPLDAIYSSPLERAIETATPLARMHHLETIICEDFQEIDFGEWTNRVIEELIPDPVFKRFNVFRSNTRIPGGELMTEAQARIIKGIKTLRSKHPTGTVAVISHADLIKSAIAYYAGIHLDMFQRIEISPASISIIGLGEDAVSIQLLNYNSPIT